MMEIAFWASFIFLFPLVYPISNSQTDIRGCKALVNLLIYTLKTQFVTLL